MIHDCAFPSLKMGISDTTPGTGKNGGAPGGPGENLQRLAQNQRRNADCNATRLGMETLRCLLVPVA